MHVPGAFQRSTNDSNQSWLQAGVRADWLPDIRACVPSYVCDDGGEDGQELKHLRAVMGHSDYGMLQRYVRLATERDLASCAEWLELIANNLATEWP